MPRDAFALGVAWGILIGAVIVLGMMLLLSILS